GAPGERLVQRRGGFIEVSGLEPTVDAGRVYFDRQTDAVVHRRGEGLSTAHSTEPPGQYDPSAQRTLKPGLRHRAKRLVGALENSLRAAVDSTSARKECSTAPTRRLARWRSRGRRVRCADAGYWPEAAVAWAVRGPSPTR